MVYFAFWTVHLVLLTVNFIFLLIFNFWGRVFSDWDVVIGILDCEYVILDDYLLFEGENLQFLIVYLVFQGKQVHQRWRYITVTLGT